MDYDRKPAPAPLPQRVIKRARVAPVPLQRQRLEQQKSEYELSRFTARPVALQRQVAQPILIAAFLRRQEETRLSASAVPYSVRSRNSVLRLPAGAIQAALGRHADGQTPGHVPARPQSAGEWVTVMRARDSGVRQAVACGRYWF